MKKKNKKQKQKLNKKIDTATTPRCGGWCYSIPKIALILPLIHTL